VVPAQLIRPITTVDEMITNIVSLFTYTGSAPNGTRRDRLTARSQVTPSADTHATPVPPWRR
jgi:hypothetical protein